MMQLSNFIKKIPSPITTQNPKQHISWHYTLIFLIFYIFGINVFFTKNMFMLSLLIKILWLTILIIQLFKEPFTFVDGFIFFSICGAYLLHFFDIFLLICFAIFLPDGDRLLNENENI